jgi:hypothetical protein
MLQGDHWANMPPVTLDPAATQLVPDPHELLLGVQIQDPTQT